MLLQSTLRARLPTLVSSTIPQSQNPLHHSYPLCPVLIDTHYPTFVLHCCLHTHTHTHTFACCHKTALFFSCQSYLVIIICLELFHAAVEQGRTPYMSCLLLVHQHSGGMMSGALQETMLPGATVLCYNINICFSYKVYNVLS